MQYMIFIFFVIAAIIFMVSGSSQRYSEPGQGVDYRNVAEYGEPVKSLYTSSEIFTLHHRIEITDGEGNVAYRAETQFPSMA